jgi:hypothetical protein
VPAFELEPTRDPTAGGKAAPDLAAIVVETAAVAVDESAGRICDQIRAA